MRALTNDAQARMARAMAQQAAGTVGYHAAIMRADGNAECRALGRQMDAELLARDRVIRSKDVELETLRAEVARLKARPL